MSTDNPFLLQKQVRDNSEDLQTFLRDMESWEKDMKKKEEELKLIKVSETEDVPPVRNSFSRSKTKQKKEKIKSSSPPKKRLSSYDYQSWEKFDVNSELMKLDGKKEKSSESDSSDTEERLNIQKRKQLALLKKDKGNEFFKKGQYDSAINSYTVGMELDPENALLPANRAMAFLKKGQFQAAENDCSLCLSLDSTYVKAYLRRGAACKGLNKLPQAKQDFLKALELEPENKQAQKELALINEGIGNEQLIDIQNIPSSSEKLDIEFTKALKSSSRASDEKAKETEKCLLFPDAKSLPIEYSCDDSKKESFTEVKVTHSNPKEFKRILEKESKPSSRMEKEEKDQVEHEKRSNLEQATTIGSSNMSITNHDLCSDIDDVISALEQRLPPVPTASFQFLTDWKKMSKYPELRYQYLKQFPPEKFATLFKHNMEPEIFPEILNILSTSFIDNGDDIFCYLKYLASVGRFDTMLMFMSPQEKKDLKTLKSYLQTSPHSQSEIETILKLYGI